MRGKEVVRLLQQNGWLLDRVSGSHHLLKKGSVTIAVPLHGKRDLPTGTLHTILRKAGLK